MLLSRMGGHSAGAAFRARSATLNHGRRLCTPGKSSPASEKVGGPSLEEKAQHAVPTATTMFRLSNPEAFMDPNKRISWVVTGVVAAGIGVMVLYALYQDYRAGAGPFARAPTESARDPAAHSQDVLKVRVLPLMPLQPPAGAADSLDLHVLRRGRGFRTAGSS